VYNIFEWLGLAAEYRLITDCHSLYQITFDRGIKMLTQEKLKSIISYIPNTGEFKRIRTGFQEAIDAYNNFAQKNHGDFFKPSI
jgi:hypothetical protein